jgi:hypothetical protein
MREKKESEVFASIEERVKEKFESFDEKVLF